MHPLLRKLEGGDRRSIGRSEEVVLDVLRDPDLLEFLIVGLSVDDANVRMRAADAMEKISAKHPEYLWPHKGVIIEQAVRSDQKEVRWHLAQMLPRLRLSSSERALVADVLLSYCRDRSSIVKTFSMQALSDLAGQDPALRRKVQVRLRKLVQTV
jgi:hypothetical protein